MTLQAVFFDLDGTLLDTAQDLGNALNRLLMERGKEPLPDVVIRRVVSDGANAMLALAFDVHLGDPDHAELRERLLAFYLEDIATHTRPFDGIEEIIAKLTSSSLKWGIVTNKPWIYTEALMAYCEFASTPAAIVCPDHVSQRKPDPEALFLACEQAQCEPQQAIYVGDHKRDIECGNKAGMPTIAVGYGYIREGDSHEKWQADHCVNSAQEIWPIIQAYL